MGSWLITNVSPLYFMELLKVFTHECDPLLWCVAEIAIGVDRCCRGSSLFHISPISLSPFSFYSFDWYTNIFTIVYYAISLAHMVPVASWHGCFL